MGPEEKSKLVSFAETAAKVFSDNPNKDYFTEKGMQPGCLLALRSGLSDDSVVVVKLDDNYPISGYGRLMKK